MSSKIVAFIAGVIFSIGLGLSGMMDPKKVVSFLNIFNEWDPSLMMVMVGAILFNIISFKLILTREKPIITSVFSIPNLVSLDKNILMGPVLFGIGWGLTGICPGPAIANLASATYDSVFFVSSMICGMLIYKYSFQSVK